MLRRHHPHEILKEIQKKTDKLIRRGKAVTFCWIPAHVGVPGNEKADKAAKEAINSNQARDRIPIKDYHPSLKKMIWKRWQNLWNISSIFSILRRPKGE